jgi:hypothetical protein
MGDGRLQAAVQTGCKTDTLVGSFFLSDAKRGWQGCVVAEVAPAVYLVEPMSWLDGGGTEQQLARLEDMDDWTFYDDAEWRNNAYENGIKQAWDAARGD